MRSFPLILVLVLFPIIPACTQPDFTARTAGNPVIPRGPAGAWDFGLAFRACLTVVSDTFYLCYNGSIAQSSQPVSIGLATSTDGFTFTKSDSNPILTADGSGFDAYKVGNGHLFYDNNTWYLYYTGTEAPNMGPGRIISRATAANPHGPWIRTNDALLLGGSIGEWDDKVANPLPILPIDTGLVMYYWGADEWHPYSYTCQIGMAVSTDGGHSWLKYDDPATTSPPYAESDPVLKAGPESFDADGIYGAGIVRKGNQWEMFYGGSSGIELSICYATSSDGTHWTKYPGNPIYTFWEDPLAVYALIQTPTVAFHDSSYFLYYDYSNYENSAGIGLATAPVVGIDPPVENKISDFILYQNYPNPFNASTIISWQLARQNNSAGQVRLAIYDLSGKQVALLVNERQAAGQHWVKFDASDLASGIYLYELQAGNFVESKKMILIR